MGGKVSGREIRRLIIENDMELPSEVAEVLPESTINILEKGIKNGTIPGNRDLKTITKRMNTYSRSKLTEIAHLNADAINSIIKGRFYREEPQIWAAFRRAGYGPVLTRLAISAIEEEVTKKEVLDLIKSYEKQGIIPPDQKVDRVVERAWFVSQKKEHDLSAQKAHEKFRKGIKLQKPPCLSFDAGLSIRSFEVEQLKTGMDAGIYVDQNGFLACEIRTEKKKIKSPMKLPAEMATYLRLLIDSHFIPINAKVVEKERGIRIRINVG
jgi:predicted nucleotidyltransferase